MVWKKSVYNFNFIEEDTFDLGLIMESLQGSENISKQIYRSEGAEKNVRFIKSKFALKEGGFITAKAFINGPHYYLLAARSKEKKTRFSTFFNSFKFTSYKYHKPEKYIDSVLKMRVITSVNQM